MCPRESKGTSDVYTCSLRGRLFTCTYYVMYMCACSGAV